MANHNILATNAVQEVTATRLDKLQMEISQYVIPILYLYLLFIASLCACMGVVLHVPFMTINMHCMTYVPILYLPWYSVNGRVSIMVRVRVWYYFIIHDRYMK